MIEAGKLDLTFKRGKTVLLDPTFPFSLAGCRVRQHIRTSIASNGTVLEYDSANGSITLEGNKAIWSKVPISIAPRKYVHDIEVTQADGTVLIWLEGSFTVTQTVTR